MISMKVQKKESKQSGNPARSLILVTVCTCTAIAFAAGGRIADFNGKNKAHAGQNYGNARVHGSAAWRCRHIRAIFKVGRCRCQRTAFGLWQCTVEGCEGGSGQRGLYRPV